MKTNVHGYEMELPEKVEHTPTPWDWNCGNIYRENRNEVNVIEDPTLKDEDAEFIVRAVNAYEADKKKMKALVDAATDALDLLEKEVQGFPNTKRQLRKAIAQAEGRP